MFKNKILLITGGTGSFGSTVLKKWLRTSIKEIRIFSRDEKKQEEIRMKFNSSKLKFYIGDVRNYQSLNQALKGVDFVFHAAALKQVPSCEFYPNEAFQTNVTGSENVMNAAISNGVSRVIMLSTDKAVYPINAMGISKAMMEKFMIAKARITSSSTILCATRYGNVMGSRGSVIPLFISQLRNKKPLTITDPKMTRFLMTLEESMDLVLYAFKHARQGDIFVQKAPACTVENLALALKQIYGSKSELKIIGTRHGEKLYESLISREEMHRADDLGNYFRIPSDNRDLNYSNFFSRGVKKISETEDYTSHNTKQLCVQKVRDLLLNLDFIKEELND